MIMRYFTWERYEKMQVRGCLTFHETEEDLLADKQWYAKEGLNFEERQLESYKWMEPLIERFIPEELKAAIARGEGDLLGIHMPAPAFRAKVEAWRSELERDWENARNSYWERYKAIESRLPDCRDKLHMLHDSIVLDVKADETAKSIELRLNASGSMLVHKRILLRFRDVSGHHLTQVEAGDWWLYEELDAGEDGSFELRALLDTQKPGRAFSELSITARSVDYIIEEAAPSL
ncbi:DUF4085 family protein [Paenibacillus nanensis]|uniref:DUF4085 family protein n=1 Tax=Paenibacillus nanensis TaxID=393251 RepID=A0A3A1URP0_9BACL|nr:DUF4085 family protein [Paenibacillus nanensis]RIX49383.1 DUF4085 family protein [Paenibacillus nanensis]